MHGFTPEHWAAMSPRERARASNRASRARRTPEQIEKSRASSKAWRDKRSPELIERARASRKAWLAKRTPEQAERDKQTQKRYFARRMETAAGREARNACLRKYYHRMKADADWREKRNARRRIGTASTQRVSENLARALGQNELHSAAARAAPKRLPRWVRDDVIADMVLAVLEGQARVDELTPQAEAFVSRHYREYETFDLRSIDEKDETGRTLADTLTEQHLPW